MSHHADSVWDHVAALGKDLAGHTSAEREHLISGIFEKGAATILRVAGTIYGDPTVEAAGRMLDAQADKDIDAGHLNFHDYKDIYKTIDHLV